jgi:hypothetical protein
MAMTAKFAVRLDASSLEFLDEFAFNNNLSRADAMRLLIDQARGLNFKQSGYRSGRNIGFATVLEAVQTAVANLPKDLPDSEK